jgi:molybdopterin molybdotransferase
MNNILFKNQSHKFFHLFKICTDMNSSPVTEYITVDEALRILRNLPVQLPVPEEIQAAESVGRITAEDTAAERDIPRFDNSAMDGFIFLKSDVDDGKRKFIVEGEIRPEHEKPGPLAAGTSARIMTGAPVPRGGYIVVPVEEVKEHEGRVEILSVPGRNPIRRQGEGYKKGRTVLEKGSVIRPYEAGLLIESGNHSVQVLKPLQIAVQVTGSEIDEDLDSNGPVLHSLISRWPGVRVRRMPVLDDKPDTVLKRMKELRKDFDAVITTGGISAGRHDYILQSMIELGADVLIRKIRQKPGKPFTVTMLEGVPFFHLPGNPVSALFTAEYYVRKAVLGWLGLAEEKLKALLSEPAANLRGEKTLFLTGKMHTDSQNRICVSTEGGMRSHLMQLYLGNHAYVRLDSETEYSAGDTVEVTPFLNHSLFM